MRNKWLNLVLLLTNRIYTKKQQVISKVGWRALLSIFWLIFLEIILGIVSLPLYLSLKSEGVTAFLEEKGTYAKVSFDYNLRRILTVSGISVFAGIWAVKLLLILIVPTVIGPLQLYSISNFNPADISAKSLASEEVGAETARIISSLPAPELMAVNKIKGGSYEFIGSGAPGMTVVLLLSDEQTAVYTADVDAVGNWKISHSRENFQLREGNHSVLVFSYDKKLGVRSSAAPEQFFKATATWLDSFTKNVDVLANWSVVIILLMGVFLTFLTI